jgi:recombinational DNA repair ATPase RecF
MSNQITIEKISLAGFRAYLQEQTFRLRKNNKPASLAVFAPNAKGKTSLTDSVEFSFSEEGTLERLGERLSGTQAGREALEHFGAQDAGITPIVSITFREASNTVECRREVAQPGQTLPEAARRILSTRKVNFIIRGHQLRQFVESQTPYERHQEVSEWFGLSPLTEIQHNLRDLRLRTKRELDNDSALNERHRDLTRVTGGALNTFDEQRVLTWVNITHLQSLDPTLSLARLDKEAPAYQAIKERKEQEEQTIGITALRQIISAIQELYVKDAPQSDGSVHDAGALPVFEDADKAVQTAYRDAQHERGNAEKAVFTEVWEAASKIFADTDIDACPVCTTPVSQTTAGSSERIAIYLHNQLDNLGAYRIAEEALQKAKSAVQQRRQKCASALENLERSLRTAEFTVEAQAVIAYKAKLTAWTESEPLPDASALQSILSALLDRLEQDCQRIVAAQGDRTFGRALAQIDTLIDLKIRLTQIKKTKAELKKLYESLLEQEIHIKEKIQAYIQAVIDRLENRVNELYPAVQPGQAPNIILDLAPDSQQPRLDLFIDFSPNRQRVVPSGYLSDSQVHTLALSLRLAAIQLFNADIPIIVLDDVVTSYDIDHRKKIAAMLAEKFSEFQIILVTHDEQFFQLLRDHLPEQTWIFKHITGIERDFGPIFSDHKTLDRLIEEKLERGEPAANDIRRAQEEWLKRICRDFGVNVRIREVNHPHSYDRAELAEALHSFLKDKGIGVPAIPGTANPFLLSLQRGVVENFGSHFQDNPNASGSIGDEQHRWQEFKEFRDMFTCTRGHKRFKRPRGMNSPVCQKCETPFAFSIPSTAQTTPSGFSVV